MSLVRTSCSVALAALVSVLAFSTTLEAQGLGGLIRRGAEAIKKKAEEEAKKGQPPPQSPAPATGTQTGGAPSPQPIAGVSAPAGGVPEPDYRSLLQMFMAQNADILNVDSFAWEHYLVFEVGDAASQQCLSLRTELSNEFSSQRLMSKVRASLAPALQAARAWQKAGTFRLIMRSELGDYDFGRHQFPLKSFPFGGPIRIARTKSPTAPNVRTDRDGTYQGSAASICTQNPPVSLAGRDSYLGSPFGLGFSLNVMGAEFLRTAGVPMEQARADQFLRSDAVRNGRWVDIEVTVDVGPIVQPPASIAIRDGFVVPARVTGARVLERDSERDLYTYDPASFYDPLATPTPSRVATLSPAGTSATASPSGVAPLDGMFGLLLTVRDVPAAITDQALLDITRDQIFIEQEAWKRIGCVVMPTAACGGRPVSAYKFNPKRPGFFYEWQKYAGQANPTTTALLDVFMRRDADWSFVTREREWDERFDQIVDAFVFSREAIEGRQANFAAQELAPVYKQLLTSVAAKVPTRYSFSVALPPCYSYDFSAKAIRFLDPSVERSSLCQFNAYKFAERLDILPAISFAASGPGVFPDRAASTANYGYYGVKVPEAQSRKPGIAIGDSPATLLRAGRFGQVGFDTLALDRQLELTSIPMDGARAEALEKLRSDGRGGSRPLSARIQLEAQKVEAATVVPKGMTSAKKVLFARVERVEFLDPSGGVLMSLTSDQLKPPAPPSAPQPPAATASAAAVATPAARPEGMAPIFGEWVFRPSGQPGAAPAITLTFTFPATSAPRYSQFTFSGPGGLTGGGQFQVDHGSFFTTGGGGVSKRGTLILDDKGILHMVVEGGGRDPLPNGSFDGTHK